MPMIFVTFYKAIIYWSVYQPLSIIDELLIDTSLPVFDRWLEGYSVGRMSGGPVPMRFFRAGFIDFRWISVLGKTLQRAFKGHTDCSLTLRCCFVQ